MDSSILTAAEQAVLREERELLRSLAGALERLEASPENRSALERAIQQLDEFFLLVIVGEFNAGKSAFINALLGSRVLAEGVTPTTTQVQLIRYGDTSVQVPRSAHLLEVTAPLELLREIHIVDTPGTNAVLREHEEITADFVPRADLVLFVTSADRPFSESERLFLAAVREWGKKVVIVLNKVDLFEQPTELGEVLAFVADHGRRLLGEPPEIFPVSARLALRAKQGTPSAWPASGFEELERFIRERLDERERVRLKLVNPLGVGAALTSRYIEVTDARLDLLRDDLRLLEDVERQLTVYREDMERQFELRIARVENTLLEMEARGHAYFDEMLRPGRMFDLLNKSRVQEGFERDVVADTPARLEREVSDLIDWLVAAEHDQWRAVTHHLRERQRQYKDRIIADPEATTSHVERGRLIESVGREAQRVVDSYDRRREAAELAENARKAVATAAAAGAGALGLGAAVTAIATTAAMDVTGLLMAGVLATLGLLVIPARRRKAKAEMREKVSRMRETLTTALRDQFEKELARGGQRVSDAMAPYSRFVRAEHGGLVEGRDALVGLRDAMAVLRARIEGLASQLAQKTTT
jgi:small GTP-binding protein